MTPVEAEVLGTFFLILLGGGVCANTTLNRAYGQGAGWLVVTLGWGLAVFVGVSVAGPYSGAHINPAVTVGLALAGKFSWSEVPFYIAAQVVGAMLGAVTVWLVYRGHYIATPDPDAKRGTFCTGPAIANAPQNFLSELVGTFALVLVVLYFTEPTLQAQELSEVRLGLGSLGALPVALLVVSIGMSLGGTTGYAINPARDLGPRIVYSVLPIPDKGGSQWSYAWVPVLGPVAGAAAAAVVFLAFS